VTPALYLGLTGAALAGCVKAQAVKTANRQLAKRFTTSSR
jgi:hypothetical protein